MASTVALAGFTSAHASATARAVLTAQSQAPGMDKIQHVDFGDGTNVSGSCQPPRPTLVRSTSATINGQVTANSSTAHARFEWETDPNNLSAIPVQVLTQETGISAPLAGLSPSTTYYYVVVASNAQGTTTSGTESFRTPAA